MTSSLLTSINALATKLKGMITTHENKTSSTTVKGHAQAGGAPQAIGTSLNAGTDNGYYARADHVHTVDYDNILNTPDNDYLTEEEVMALIDLAIGDAVEYING